MSFYEEIPDNDDERWDPPSRPTRIGRGYVGGMRSLPGAAGACVPLLSFTLPTALLSELGLLPATVVGAVVFALISTTACGIATGASAGVWVIRWVFGRLGLSPAIYEVESFEAFNGESFVSKPTIKRWARYGLATIIDGLLIFPVLWALGSRWRQTYGMRLAHVYVVVARDSMDVASPPSISQRWGRWTDDLRGR